MSLVILKVLYLFFMLHFLFESFFFKFCFCSCSCCTAARENGHGDVGRNEKLCHNLDLFCSHKSLLMLFVQHGWITVQWIISVRLNIDIDFNDLSAAHVYINHFHA